MAYGGKRWCPSHIAKVLINEKFKGDTMFQKTFNSDYLTKSALRIEENFTSIILKILIQPLSIKKPGTRFN
jgi:hypothetical protein